MAQSTNHKNAPWNNTAPWTWDRCRKRVTHILLWGGKPHGRTCFDAIDLVQTGAH